MSETATAGATFYLSYAQDSRRDAKRLAEHLAAAFGRDAVVHDQHFGASQTYAEVIERQIQQCRVMLVLVGPPGLNSASQWRRFEIATALRRGKQVLLVFLDTMAIRQKQLLPPELEPLIRRRALVVRRDHFDQDVAPLTEELHRLLKAEHPLGLSPRKGQAAPPPLWHSALTTSLTRTRRRVAQVLHPLGGEVLPAITVWRAAFWLALLALLLWGVVWPYLWPALMPTPAAVAAIDEPLPAATGPVLPVGTRFRDCRDSTCPWLRVLPAGTFTMGSPENEPERADNEGPQHQVTVAKPFAVMETEVTVSQFSTFVRETGYQVQAGCSVGFEQTNEDPVVCVSWYDAGAFARWMSRRTGQTYRLLSESEWEYAARAGKTTPFAFGERITTAQANFDGNFTYNGSAKGEFRQKTLPVGSLANNAWGLYDMHGNVWEWVQDCQNSYKAEPRNSEAVESTNCARRLLRGSGWSNGPRGARSAFRIHLEPTDGSHDIGFRLARLFPNSSDTEVTTTTVTVEASGVDGDPTLFQRQADAANRKEGNRLELLRQFQKNPSQFSVPASK